MVNQSTPGAYFQSSDFVILQAVYNVSSYAFFNQSICNSTIE